VHAPTLTDEVWQQIDTELRRRSVDALQAEVAARLPRIAVTALEELLDPVHENDGSRPEHVLRDAFRDAGDDAALIALYVYGLCLQKWERSEDYDRIERVGDALAAVAADRGLAGLIARRTKLVADETTVEDALSCSCPVAFGQRARVVRAGLQNLLEDLDGGPGLVKVIRADLQRARAYYDAVVQAAHAVEEFAVEDRPSDARYFDGALEKLDWTLAGDSLSGDVFESELRAHRATLAALRDSAASPRLRVREATVVYVFPFSLHGKSSSDLVVEALGHDPVDALAAIGLDAIARELEINDLWQRKVAERETAKEYFGTEIELPPIEVTTTANEHIHFTQVGLRLSGLGNHYLRASCELEDAGIHELNQALRRGSRAMGGETLTSGRMIRGQFTFLDYAEEVIEAVAHALGCRRVTNLNAESHVVLAVRRMAIEHLDGSATPAGGDDLEHAVGSSLLFQPVRHLASALEEWIRYPAVRPVNLLGGEAYRGDLLARTDNTTVVFMPASPEWVIEEYEEMVEFNASIPALFAHWQHRTDELLPIGGTDATDDESHSDELRSRQGEILQLDQEVRHELTTLHSPLLCRTLGQRQFLDRLWAHAGFADLQADIERRLGSLAAQQEAIVIILERRRTEHNERVSHRIELVLGVLAWTSLVGVVDFVDTQFDVHKRGWIWFEVALGVVMLAFVVVVILWDRLRPFFR
jgi:hypothetical protein